MCQFCFGHVLDSVCACLCGANRAYLVCDCWACSNSGFVRSLGLIVFFGFDLFLFRSERSPLRNIWACSNVGLVRIFWIWFILFAERAKRAQLTRKLLGLLKF